MKPLTLSSILSTGRPHGGHMETHLRTRIQRQHGGTVDHAGNLSITIGESPVLFSAHLDTMHRTDGYIGFSQKGANYHAVRECLGADDGAGVWILLQMIHNEIPGTYVFTVGEEVGAIGASSYDVPRHIQACISFDRRGCTDVVYVQGGRPSGSRETAQWICDALGMAHAPSTGGTFSDNAMWSWEVPECINISVGYKDAHTPLESLDGEYLLRLLSAVLQVPWASLPIHRDPNRDTVGTPWGPTGDHSFNMGDSTYRYSEADVKALVIGDPTTAAQLLLTHVDPENLFWEFLRKA